MKKLAAAFFSIALFAVAALAQQSPGPSAESKPAPKVFRATKDQIKEVQTKLTAANLYTGEATGTLNTATRTAIKQWQGENGLKKSGTLNRATLEKMGIELTENQKLIPVSPSSFASEKKDTGDKPKRTIFRATKEQITEAQKKLKAGNLYSGEETGKLNDATRDGLKKFQEANGLKATGTLNQVTLEKMGIELTDKQKAASAAQSK
jgi:peptidoglycan hydrolase-like protein with peptidoglycan-binding domain